MKFEIAHLTNVGTKSQCTDEQLITSTEDFYSFIDNLQSKLIWLINVHLLWEGQKLSSNYGFDIAHIIRLQIKSLAPIILYSPIETHYFEGLTTTKQKYKLLFAKGTYVLQTPLQMDQIYAIATKPHLSKISLLDISSTVCNLKGIIIERLNHDLIYGDIVSNEKVIKSVSTYLNPFQRLELDLPTFEIKLSSAKNELEFSIIKMHFISTCEVYLNDEKNVVKIQCLKTPRYKILILDDHQIDLTNAHSTLHDLFEVVAVSNAIEAIEILQNDQNNSILAVIADWRLYTDVTHTYWQPVQGYEVLEFAANQGIRALFALTAQVDYIVHEIRNNLTFRFILIKKETLKQENNWRFFKEILHEACLEAVNARASRLDQFSKWNSTWLSKGIEQPSLKQQYIQYYNSSDRDNFNLRINKESKAIYMLLLASEYNILGQGDLAQWGISNKVFLLQKTLIIRRVWLAVWYHLQGNVPRDNVDVTAHTKKVYNTIFGQGSAGSIAQKLLALCFQQDKMSQEYYLPEEVLWLKELELL